jgi:hypothetical protein
VVLWPLAVDTGALFASNIHSAGGPYGHQTHAHGLPWWKNSTMMIYRSGSRDHPPSGTCNSFRPFAEVLGDGYSCLASMPAGRLGMLYVQIDPNDPSLGDPLSNIVFRLVTQQW